MKVHTSEKDNTVYLDFRNSLILEKGVREAIEFDIEPKGPSFAMCNATIYVVGKNFWYRLKTTRIALRYIWTKWNQY